MNKSSVRTTFFWDSRLHAVHTGILPWILFILSFGVYYATLQPWVLPGESSTLAAMLVGAIPDTTPYHFVWKNLMRLVAGSGDGMVFRMNAFNAFLGAGAVFFFYHVVIQLLAWGMDPRKIDNSQEVIPERSYENAEHACRLGAISASLVFAFAIPIWMCATRVYEHSFYLFWLLGSAYTLLTFARTNRPLWLVLGMALQSVGMTQTAAFIAFFPFDVMFLLIALRKEENHRLKNLLWISLLSMIPGIIVLFGAAYSFVHSEGYVLIGSSHSVLYYVVNMARTLIQGIYGSISKAPWLILIGLSVAPCLASLVLAPQALKGEFSARYLLLHAIITGIVVLDVVECRVSPWRFMGTNGTTVIPYLLIALTYAYMAAYLYLLPRSLHAYSLWTNLLLHALRKLAPAFFVALPLWAIYANSLQAARCRTPIFRTYADRLLEGLEGRTWLASDSSLDTLLLLRAKERGQELHCVNPSRTSLRAAHDTLTDESLRNATVLGLTSLLQEWISHPEEAMHDLALLKAPELWTLGGVQIRPNKLVFLGEKAGNWTHIDVAQTIKEHEALWKEMQNELEPLESILKTDFKDKLPGDAPTRIVQFCVRRILIPQMSLVGNNLAFALSQLAQADETEESRRDELQAAAFSLYTKVHAFDKANLSATLNWARYILTHETEEKQEEARKALAEIHESFSKNKLSPHVLGAISRSFGFVEDPAFFEVLGWEWARSGQYEFVIQNLKNAQKKAPEHEQSRYKSNLARLHMAASKPIESERYYLEVLEEDPGDLEALMGLVRLHLNQGDTQKARDYLQRAEKAGGDATALQLTLAEICIQEGDHERADALLQEIVDRDPTNTDAWAMLCTHWYTQKNLESLSETVKKLDELLDAEAYSVLIAHGLQEQLKALLGDNEMSMETRLEHIHTARDFYLHAFRVHPRNPALWNRILEIDFQLADKTGIRTHAMEVLRMDRNHPFANYCMSMLAIEKGDNKSAVEYLRRSNQTGGSVASLNDYAYLLCTLGKLDEAAEVIHLAFQKPKADESDALWDTHGMILLKQGKLDEAENAFQIALSLNDDNLPTHLHLAALYSQQGKSKEALETLRLVAPHSKSLTKDDAALLQELQTKLSNPQK